MTKQIITIAIETDIDSSQLLDIADEFGRLIAEQVEGYGESASFLSEETAVEIVSGGGTLNNV
tara:strand:- start:2218 stop:2406 length:189 start_codon:yes stop_codon:yes gene_type:complete